MSDSERTRQATIAEMKPRVIEMEPGTYFWCSCGESASQPFCDGSHKKGGCFSPHRVVIEKKEKVAWCCCKRSKKGCFCDGSHKSLLR